MGVSRNNLLIHREFYPSHHKQTIQFEKTLRFVLSFHSDIRKGEVYRETFKFHLCRDGSFVVKDKIRSQKVIVKGKHTYTKRKEMVFTFVL